MGIMVSEVFESLIALVPLKPGPPLTIWPRLRQRPSPMHQRRNWILIFCLFLPAHACTSQTPTRQTELGRYAASVEVSEKDLLDATIALAEAGLPESQHSLGVMFYQGENVLAQNYVMAAKWFREAAFQGFAPAQLALVRIYTLGHGVTTDRVEACAWAILGAGALPGDSELQSQMAKVTRLAPPHIFAAAQKRAVELLQQIEDRKKHQRQPAPIRPPSDSPQELQETAGQGSLTVAEGHGQMYATDQGVPRDLIKATTSSRPKLAQATPKFHEHPQAVPAPSPELALQKNNEVEEVLTESGTTTTVPEPTDKRVLPGEVTPPTVLSRIEPVYSEAARKAILEGTVELSAIIRKDGSIEGVKVLRGLGLGLDESAVRALRNWRFRPGMKDGSPVDLRINIEVTFSLRSPP